MKDISDEIPFDLPKGWTWARLGIIFQHNTGKALNRNNSSGVMREYITTSNVYWDEFKLDGLNQMPFTEEELVKCSIRKGDLLVCEGGDIGRAAIWNSERAVCIQNHLHRLRPFVNVCVPYFSIVLRLYKATNRLQGKGIGLQGFSSGMLHNLLVPTPSVAEQHRIVAKVNELFSCSDVIAKTGNCIIKTSELLDKKILDLAIRGQLVPQDKNDEPASALVRRIQATKKASGKRSRDEASFIFRGSDRLAYETKSGNTTCIQDEVPFDIPDSWEWVRLKSIGTFVGGHTPSLADRSNWENGSILWVTSKDMKQKYIDDTGCKLSETGAKTLQRLPAGTLLMVTRSGILRRTFPLAIARKELTINQDQRALVFHDVQMSEFVYLALKGFEDRILKEYRKTGTTVESIIWEKFVNLLVPIPPLEEQKRIVEKVGSLESMTHRILPP